MAISDNEFEILVKYINVARRYVAISNNTDFRELRIYNSPELWGVEYGIPNITTEAILYYERDSADEIVCWFRHSITINSLDNSMLKLIGFEEVIRGNPFEQFMVVNDKFISRISELYNLTDEEFYLYIKMLNL